MTRIIVDESTYNAVKAFGKPRRPNIQEFQSRLRDLTLAHGTDTVAAEVIRTLGFRGEYSYFCCGKEGWDMPKHRGETVHLLVPGEVVHDRCYPDPEGQWGRWGSMGEAVEDIGLERALDALERDFDLELPGEYDDPLDPENYNLVVIGPIGPELILKEAGR